MKEPTYPNAEQQAGIDLQKVESRKLSLEVEADWERKKIEARKQKQKKSKTK